MAQPVPDAILETALYVDDLDEAAAFYGKVFGLVETMREEGRHVFFGCGPGMLLLFRAEATREPSASGLPVPPHGAVGEGHVCFRAEGDRIEAWADRFRECGIDIESDFFWPNGARSIYVRDPSRNSVEVSEPKLWGRPT